MFDSLENSDEQSVVPQRQDAYTMRRQLFAKLTRALRHQRKLTQAELASKSNKLHNVPLLTTKLLGKIERAEKALLDYEIVGILADALELEGIARSEFFAYAGLLMTSEAQDNSLSYESLIADFYASLTIPAFVHDSLFNLHSVNSYAFAAFEIKAENFERALFESGGPNILRILFAPQFSAKTAWVGVEQWLPYVEWHVYLFRLQSKHLISTDRYQILVKTLKMMPHFKDVWSTVEKPNFKPNFSLPTVFAPAGKSRLQFTIANIYISKIIMSDLEMMLYSPADPATKQYVDAIASKVTHSFVRFNIQKSRIEHVTLPNSANLPSSPT